MANPEVTQSESNMNYPNASIYHHACSLCTYQQNEAQVVC